MKITRSRLAASLAVVLLAAGCSSAPEPVPEPAPREPPPSLAVSVQQQRPDESTRVVGVDTTNRTNTVVHVSGVRLRGGGLDGPLTPLDTDLQPGLTVALRTSYGRPRCADRTGAVTAYLLIDGRLVRYAVDPDGQDEIRRLVDFDCAGIQLARNVGVRLAGPYRAVVVGQTPMLRGRLVLTRRTPGAPVDVRSLGGSVLLDLLPVDRLVDLRTDDDRAVTPVLVGSNGRCDAHARGGSTQTFLLSAYVRLGDRSEHRVVLTPPSPVQARVLDVVDRECDRLAR